MSGFTEIWQYMPHGMCLLWQPWLVILWAGSDLLIFLSYMAIPLALMLVLSKRKDVPHSGLVALFAGFILLCGFTHLLSIVTLWYPIYPWVGLVKLATGVVSAMTAIVLFRMVPALIAFPSPRELEILNRNLREEAAAHDDTLVKLRAARDNLEQQVADRTRELEEANAKLAVATREAIHRSGNLLAVVSSLAKQSARDMNDIGEFVDTFTGRLRALKDATASVMVGEDKTSQEVEVIIRNQLAPLTDAVADRVHVGGPSLRIGSDAAQQVSLAIHELATNAQKYGLLDDTNSQIDVTWHVTEGDEPVFELEWREQLIGKGPEDFAETQGSGFGSKLLTRVVPGVLRGKAERAFEEGMLFYRLSAPLETMTAREEAIDADNFAADIIDRSFGKD